MADSETNADEVAAMVLDDGDVVDDVATTLLEAAEGRRMLRETRERTTASGQGAHGMRFWDAQRS